MQKVACLRPQQLTSEPRACRRLTRSGRAVVSLWRYHRSLQHESVSFSAVFSALFAFPVSVQRAICQTDRKVAEEVKLHVDTTTSSPTYDWKTSQEMHSYEKAAPQAKGKEKFGVFERF